MTLPIPLVHSVQVAYSGEVVHARRLGGGCIHEVRHVRFADGRQCCLKFQDFNQENFLEAEADGLRALAPHIRVPDLHHTGETHDHRWLGMEWLDLLPHSPDSLASLGLALSHLHSVTSITFGHHRDNFLGRTPQINTPCESWLDFYLECRITPMIRALHDSGHPLPSLQIFNALSDRLAGHNPTPSLLHGDLWMGNTATLPGDIPVVYDPAVYFGDAESDLAMLELFGGTLPDAFSENYARIRPLAEDRPQRRPAYDLLHAMNHVLLFGSAYEKMLTHCLKRLGV